MEKINVKEEEAAIDAAEIAGDAHAEIEAAKFEYFAALPLAKSGALAVHGSLIDAAKIIRGAAVPEELRALYPFATAQIETRIAGALLELGQARRMALAVVEDAEAAYTLENAPEKSELVTQKDIRQFWAVARKSGLNPKAERAQILAAVGAFVGREIESRNELTQREMTGVLHAMEDGRLVW